MDTFKGFLLEGGNAVDGVGRINQLNVADTITKAYDELLVKLGIGKDEYAILGSGGKKDPKKNGEIDGSSGDIDIAIGSKLDRDAILNKISGLCAELGYQSKLMAGLGIISLAFPIHNTDGKQDRALVQLDIIPVQDIKYAEWAYYSPSYDESPYKGLYRNEALFYLARFNNEYKVTKEIDGTPVEWERLFYDLSKGLMHGTQHRVGKKGGIIKTVTTITKKVISTNPDDVVKRLIGDTFTAQSILTWEDIWAAMNSENFMLKDKKDKIFKSIAKGIERKKVPIPTDLENIV